MQSFDRFLNGPNRAAPSLVLVGEAGKQRIEDNHRISAVPAGPGCAPVGERAGRERRRCDARPFRFIQKQPDVLRLTVIEELKLLLAEVGDGFAVLVLRDHSYLNQLNVGLKDRGRRRIGRILRKRRSLRCQQHKVDTQPPSPPEIHGVLTLSRNSGFRQIAIFEQNSRAASSEALQS